MAAPKGTIVDLNLVKRKINKLQRLIQRDKVTEYKALSDEILDDVDAIDTLIQASTHETDLSSAPTIELEIDPD